LPSFRKENSLTELRNIAGDRYWETTMHCLVAHGEGGMRIDEGVSQSQGLEIKLQLQDAFTALVVNELKSVSI
jgi:outer membrane lipoprotein SlyB